MPAERFGYDEGAGTTALPYTSPLVSTPDGPTISPNVPAGNEFPWPMPPSPTGGPWPPGFSSTCITPSLIAANCLSTPCSSEVCSAA